jgi:N-acyl-D-aspartate/D-glutamate deacylase
MGDENRPPTSGELEQMKQLVEQAMRDGAGGLSTALIYPPAIYASTEELIELAKVAARDGSFYSSHMRNESGSVLEAIDEALRIGREASIPVHIYHLKAAGRRNTDAGEYPQDVGGLSVAQAAKKLGKDVWDTFFELAQANADCAPQSMDEEQKRLALHAPWVMIETDTGPVNPATVTSTHPRAFGSFPRVLAKYVREDRVLTLEDAIRRMTSLPANRLGLRERGRIAPGMAADLVIFDPARIQDRATYEQPLQYAEGVDYLLINGKLAIDGGKTTAAHVGKVLKAL